MCEDLNLENAVEPRLAAQLGEIARPFGFFVLTIAVAMLARDLYAEIPAKIPLRFRLIASTSLGSTAFSRLNALKRS
jgi:hypothetical protein